MLLPALLVSPAPKYSQGEFSKANCAGQGCEDREGCRRFRVRIVGPSGEWERQFGQWISADLERAEMPGSCPYFVRYREDR